MRRERRLAIVLSVNLVLVITQAVFGVAAHSLGLLADAAHNLTDVVAVGVSLFAVKLARKRATATRSFGLHRGTVLAAQANALLLLVTTAALVVEGIRRLGHPDVVRGGVVAIVASVALVINLVAASLLQHDRKDLNMRSAFLHSLGDALTSAGVVVAGAVIFITDGLYWLDPAISIVIGLFIGYQAVHLLGEAAHVLLESTPSELNVDNLAIEMQQVEGVESLHDLHVWTLSSDLYALSAHVIVDGHPTLEQARVIGDRVKAMLWSSFHIGHATLELECEACHDSDQDPCGVNAVQATADHDGHSH